MIGETKPMVTDDDFTPFLRWLVKNYNYNEERKANIYKSFTYFKMFISDNTTENFYDWLNKNTNYIDDYCSLCVSYLMFDISGLSIEKYKNMPIRNGPINKEELMDKLSNLNINFKLADSIEQSIKAYSSNQNTITLIVGSLYLVGEVLNLN